MRIEEAMLGVMADLPLNNLRRFLADDGESLHRYVKNGGLDAPDRRALFTGGEASEWVEMEGSRIDAALRCWRRLTPRDRGVVLAVTEQLGGDSDGLVRTLWDASPWCEPAFEIDRGEPPAPKAPA